MLQTPRRHRRGVALGPGKKHRRTRHARNPTLGGPISVLAATHSAILPGELLPIDSLDSSVSSEPSCATGAPGRGRSCQGKAMPSTPFAPKPLQIAAAVIGNALEWCDFIVFGFFAVIIARLFFPTESQYASLLLTTATFGVGFFMRPVGGILLGVYADRRGRKATLLLIIGLMTLAIAMIGFAPTYAAIGIAAPLLIVLARLLQGFSAGGEFASCTSFLIESSPAQHRGFYGSWQMVGQGLAVLTGALLGTFITRIFTPEALDSWVGAYHSSLVSSLGHWDSISAVDSMKPGPFSRHGGARANNRRLGLRSPRMSDRCWRLSESSYPARSSSM